MSHVNHLIWFVRWLQRLGSAILRRRQVFDLAPSLLLPRRRFVYDKRCERFRVFKVRRTLADYWSFDQTIATAGLSLVHWKHGEALRKRYCDMLATGRTPLIIDCGANIGCSTYWLATEFPRAVVLAVEPDSMNLQLAGHNTRYCPNVQLIQAAVSPHDCRLDIQDKGASSDSFRTAISDAGEIRGYSVASLIEIAGCSSRDLLLVKIDIEGFEKELFSANTEWVSPCGAIIVEAHDWMLPGCATAAPMLRCFGLLQRDFVVSGEHVISFSNGNNI